MSEQLRRRRTAGAMERSRRASSAPTAKLTCQAGPAAGQEFELSGEEMVLGRANEADISIPDTSVSRKHVRFRRLPEGWAVEDLGSGNGTLLNGVAVAEESPLRNGDTLVVGDTELSFSDPSQETDRRAPPAAAIRRLSKEIPVRRSRGGLSRVRPGDADDPQRRKKTLTRVAMVLSLIAALGVGAKVWVDVNRKKDAARIAEQEAQRQKVGVTLESVKALILAGRYKDAKAKLDELAPSLEQTGDETRGFVKMYQESCASEIPNEALRDEAKAALEKNLPGEARLALAKIPKASLQMNLVGELDRQIQKKLSVRLNDAREAFNQEKYDEVVAITADFLLAVPEDRDATKLNEDAKAALAKPQKLAVAKQASGPKPWDAALERYRDGDLTGAQALANECAAKKVSRCQDLVRDMTELGELNRKAESLDEKKLLRLSQLDREINGGKPSKVTAAASTRLGNLHYKRASSRKAAGDYGEAAEHAAKALQADPENAPARALLTEMRSKAKDVYIQAYTLKDVEPDQAIEKLQQVLEMTAPDDELHAKAKALKERLAR